MGQEKRKVEDPESNASRDTTDTDNLITTWNLQFHDRTCVDLAKDGSWKAVEISAKSHDLDRIIEQSPPGHLRIIFTQGVFRTASSFLRLSPIHSRVWEERDPSIYDIWKPDNPEALRQFLRVSKTLDLAWLELEGPLSHSAFPQISEIIRVNKSPDRVVCKYFVLRLQFYILLRPPLTVSAF